MKKLFLLVGICIAGMFSAQANDTYTINDTQVENLFSTATPIVNSVAVDMAGIPTSVDLSMGSGSAVADKSAIVAFLLAFFVGGLGIHRLYLGTKTFTWIGYILTCGGIFGIVPLVDWILLLVGVINDDIGDYVDNPKFFMW